MATRIRYVAPKRKTFWVRDAANMVPDTALQAVDLTNEVVAEESNLAGHTVTRVIGRIWYNTTGSTPNNRAFFGIAVRPRSDATPAGGPLVVPEVSPIDDANSVRWMTWDMLSNAYGLDAATGNFTTYQYFDVKAQRVIESQKDSVLLYFHKAPTANAQSVVLVSTSVLLKRP